MEVVYFLVNFEMLWNHTRLALFKVDDQMKLLVLCMGRITKITSSLPLFFFSATVKLLFSAQDGQRNLPRGHGEQPAPSCGQQAGPTSGCRATQQDTPSPGGVHWHGVRSSRGALKAGAAASLKGKETP